MTLSTTWYYLIRVSVKYVFGMRIGQHRKNQKCRHFRDSGQWSDEWPKTEQNPDVPTHWQSAPTPGDRRIAAADQSSV